MDRPQASRAVFALCALSAVLVGLVIYLSVTRELERPAPTAVEVPTRCPACPPRPKAPLFPKLFKPVEFTVDFYGMRYTGYSGNLIDEHVLYFGAYEKDVLHCLRDTAAALGGKQAVFVNVGANTGLHSLFMSRHVARVHAFEPYEPVLARFRATLERNDIDNVTIHPVGLGDAEAEVPFNAPPDKNLGSGSFVAGFQPGNKAAGTLRIVVGDRALAEAGADRVDLIKIDIEGYERLALRGLRQTLERSRPAVAVEVTVDPRHDETFKSAEQLLAAFPERYELRAFRQTPRHAYTGEYELIAVALDWSRPGQKMLLAYPAEKRERLTFLD